MKKSIPLLGALLLSLPLAGAAQTSTSRLVTEYDSLAGSQSNAQSLVTGLRNGSQVTLTSTNSSGTTTTTTFTPATGKMGVGNVNISLALASASLQQAGITNPTPTQLEAALNGGTVTNSSGTSTPLTGVLTMRAGGKGWGQIAQALGFKLGDVLRSEKANAALAAHKPDADRDDRVAKTERAEKAERVEKVERPERVERPDRPERPEVPERAGPGR